MRKQQVDITRIDYQAFKRQAYAYLPPTMDTQDRRELADDIARQMCLKIDKGEGVNNAYIWERCRYRVREYFGQCARLQSWETRHEPGGYQVGEVVVQPVGGQRKNKIAPEVAYRERQPLRHARRPPYRGDRLTLPERWVAFQQCLSRLSPSELCTLVDKATGIRNADTAQRLNLSQGGMANLRTRVKKQWQVFEYLLL